MLPIPFWTVTAKPVGPERPGGDGGRILRGVGVDRDEGQILIGWGRVRKHRRQPDLDPMRHAKRLQPVCGDRLDMVPPAINQRDGVAGRRQSGTDARAERAGADDDDSHAAASPAAGAGLPCAPLLRLAPDRPRREPWRRR